MILSLRQHHRRIFFALSIFLPAALIAGIAARQSVPVADALPPEIAPGETTASVLWERSDVFGKAPVSVLLLQAMDNTGARSIRLAADKNFVKPDLLVYWVPGNPAIVDSLPTNAVWLGTLDTTALPVNESMAQSPGMLVLFSLADSEIVDVSKPITLNPSTR